jgi:hypothetical protein
MLAQLLVLIALVIALLATVSEAYFYGGMYSFNNLQFLILYFSLFRIMALVSLLNIHYFKSFLSNSSYSYGYLYPYLYGGFGLPFWGR